MFVVDTLRSCASLPGGAVFRSEFGSAKGTGARVEARGYLGLHLHVVGLLLRLKDSENVISLKSRSRCSRLSRM